MVKTLRITSVAAVLLAGLVLASVLGYLKPAMLAQLGWRVGGGDKQVEKILAGPTALERFRQQNGNKVPSIDDTPPLVKQAETLAGIINPPAPPDAPVKPTGPMPPKPTLAVKPAAPVSSKFELLGTSCSSNPQFSFAYIRLPDNTVQWMGVGSEIGHVTIKEIRNGSIVCWDGTSEFPMTPAPTPETSSLLETGSASAAPVPSIAPVSPVTPRLTPGTKPLSSPVKGTSNATTYGWGHPAASAPASTLPPAPVPPTPSAQISKEEQEDLSRLGDRLRNSSKTGPVEREEVDKMIAEFRANRSNMPETGTLANPGGPADTNADASTAALRLHWKQKLLNSRARNR